MNAKEKKFIETEIKRSRRLRQHYRKHGRQVPITPEKTDVLWWDGYNTALRNVLEMVTKEKR